MTLFRKVFQNQSRPATEGEALNEDALRAAFNEMHDAKEPLILDPFEHALDENTDGDEACDSSFDALDALPEADHGIGEEAVMETVSEPHAFDPPEQVEVPETIDEVQNATALVQSDEEIAACLDRATTLQNTTRELRVPQNDTSVTVPVPETGIEGQSPAHSVATDQPQNAKEEGDKQSADAESEESETFAFARDHLAALRLPENEREDPSATPDALQDPTDIDLTPVAEIDAVPAPAPGRAAHRAGRAKTRLLGFHHSDDASTDPFGETQKATARAQQEKFPVGWLVVVEGPGVGHSFSIFTGASMIGRGEDQVIRLDFGDNSISRNNHAAVAYDQEQNKFYIGHGGKSNIIRRNARPVLSTEELHHADLIRIGETTLRFVALCGSDFKWQSLEDKNV